MLFNVSNHPRYAERTTWSADQIAEAESRFGQIIDIGFPAVTPKLTDAEMRAMAREVARDLKGQAAGQPAAAMVAGHYVMTVFLVAELQAAGIDCYIGDSVRVAEEQVQEDGSIAIVHRFQFAGFRAYPRIEFSDDVDALCETWGIG